MMRFLFSFLFLVLVPISSEAVVAPEACQDESFRIGLAVIDSSRPPQPPEPPLRVEVSVYLADLVSVDEVAQSFVADLRVELSWLDPRFAPEALGCDATGRQLQSDRAWFPPLIFFNGVDAEDSLGQGVSITSAGRMRYTQRYTSTFSSVMELEDFPLDAQSLSIAIGTILLGPKDLRIEINHERSGVAGKTTAAGWSIEPPSVDVGLSKISDLAINRIEFVFPARRDPGFFFWKAVIPLMLIVGMSWSVFWIDPKSHDAQFGVATASVFTLIAFQLSFGDLLPQIPYLTRMDLFVLGSTFFVFVALAEVVWTSALAGDSALDQARRIDRVSRFVFPACYVGFASWCFV